MAQNRDSGEYIEQEGEGLGMTWPGRHRHHTGIWGSHSSTHNTANLDCSEHPHVNFTAIQQTNKRAEADQSSALI